MQLLSITAIEEFGEAIKKILQQSGVAQYSYTSVTGYRDNTTESVGDNWFASEMNETASMLFWVFASDQHVAKVMQAVTNFNQQLQSASKIHLFTLQINQSL